MISKKSLICLVIAVALIGVGIYFALTLDTTKEVDNKDFEENYVTVYEKEVETLKEIKVVLENEEFAFLRDGDKFVKKDAPKTALISAVVNSLAYDVSTLVAKDIITESAVDISLYGLDKPKAVITAVFSDETITISIGGQTTNSAYFAKIDGDDRIFTLYSTRGDSLIKGFVNYRDLEVLDVSSSGLVKVEIKGDSETVILEKKDDKWHIAKPVSKAVTSESIDEDIFTRISSFIAEDYVDDTANNYAKYGLSNTSKSVYVEDSYGTKQRFYFGNVEDGSCYVRTEGKPGVFKMSSSVLKLFDIKSIDLIDAFVNLPHITDISKITVTSKGNTYTLENVKTDEKSVFKINGNEVSDVDYREAYKHVIGITMTDFCTDSYSISPYCTIEFLYNDKTVKRFDYTVISDRQMVVSENGACFGYVQKKSIDNALETLSK